jgi:hypothetical protein
MTNNMKKNNLKMFTVRKYIMAGSAQEAIRKDRKTPVQDVWIDDEWKKGSQNELASAIGFHIETRDDNEFSDKKHT